MTLESESKDDDDNTKISKSINSPKDNILLQKDLDSLSQWSMVSGLDFNALKSFYMSFRKDGASPCEYLLNGSRVKSVSTWRDLGVTFSQSLTWFNHYVHIIQKAYAKLSLVRRTFSVHSPTHVKKMLYLTMVRSQLTYSSQVWRPMLIKDIESLERVQRHATKYILNDWEFNYRSRLVALHLIPLHYFFELQDIIFFVSYLKHPDPSFDIYEFVSFSSSCTRSATHSK
uniref:Uncharacterized protein n=1 Tax=Amphimedon queenslandica TaxID=400682 RepID=A0A1X7SHW1_AMPQE